MAKTYCGFVGIVGITNVGKSTLINALVRTKVSIVSHKVQTTRQRILGVTQRHKTQIIFVDTPGYFSPKKRLDRAMIQAATATLEESDVTLFLVDPLAKNFEKHTIILKKLKDRERRTILVINKIDLVPKASLLEAIQAFSTLHTFEKVFLVSALTNEGIEDILSYLTEELPEGPWLYPEDQVIQQPLGFYAAEITREKIYEHLHQELPYAIHVETESLEEFQDGSLKISQLIHVEREGHKNIVLGHQGQKIKTIGSKARVELGRLLGRPIHLKLHVRVTPTWSEDPEKYAMMGLEFKDS